MTRITPIALVLLCWLALASMSLAWTSVQPLNGSHILKIRLQSCSTRTTRLPPRHLYSSSSTRLYSSSFDDSLLSSLLVAVTNDAASGWRQYVPLVVSGMVLLDIVLGSPAANGVLSIVQRKVDEKDNRDDGSNNQDEDDSGMNTSSSSKMRQQSSSSVTSKPRIDVDAFVEQALTKAENMQSLREYLDARKTDGERMRDIRRMQDQQMAKLDSKNRRSE
ncbi:hypothetical protein MPSEU_000867700 [Mayamaea pseudoterrestris]|nr:hypothetical protein MPSEU_000867700 [Mayamaea pseudoterrestris]